MSHDSLLDDRIKILTAENKRLRLIAEYVYEDMRKEAWEEAAAFIRGWPSPSCAGEDVKP